MDQTVKYLLAIQQIPVCSLSWEVPLEKEMASHSSVYPWRIPWTEQPGGASPWDHKQLEVTEPLLHTHTHTHTHTHAQ